MKYTSERNNQLVIELLKKYNINKIVASPGATNVSFIASVQTDPFFKIISCVDERSAAYIACGMAEESGEPVVISCTGATASRNYFPGLTEAYYRKLPIIALTSTMPIERIGQNIPQIIDRTNVTNDIAKISVQIPMIDNEDDEWYSILKINEALSELNHNGSGPVHINLETRQSGDFNVENISEVKKITRVTLDDKLPDIVGKKVAIFIGAHSKMEEELIKEIDTFCEKYNAIVISDHTSNYKGKYQIFPAILFSQKYTNYDYCNIDLMIHIGNISGSYYNIKPKVVWRVNEDGKFVDTYKKLQYVFEMKEEKFLNMYNVKKNNNMQMNFYEDVAKKIEELNQKVGELPFSNIWVAKEISNKLPQKSVLHLGILNPLRTWNFFPIDKSINVYCNTGGFGIDGNISTMIGAALVAPEKDFFAIVGDLSFFYDMNIFGNRHFPNNVHILVINNGRGQEFSNYGHRASQFGEETGKYIGAAGHFGNKSPILMKNYIESLGFLYLSASNKEELNNKVNEFIKKNNKPIVFEIFTDTKDEFEALKMIVSLEKDKNKVVEENIKRVIGKKGKEIIKKIIKR